MIHDFFLLTNDRWPMTSPLPNKKTYDMKQKTSHAPAGRLKRWLIASLVIGSAAVANAQVAGDTYSYFYGENVQGSGYDFLHSLADSGYDSWQYRHNDGVISDTGQISALSPNALGTNRLSSVFSLGTFGNDVGTGVDGSVEQITSVTLWLYVASISPLGATNTYTIFTGENSSIEAVGSFTVSQTSDVGTFIGIDIPLSVALSGFTIGNGDNQTPTQLLNTYTESSSTAVFRPGFSVTTVMVIPEPSAFLLGAMGAGILLRRRRA
jgi:hypothetical protein